MTSAAESSAHISIVVIGDLVASRELPDRAGAQERLREAVFSFNERYESRMSAPLELTGGDEMKTIAQDPALAIDVISELSEQLHPWELAGGVGRGPLESSWADRVGALDGPCFHRAREAVQNASEERVWAAARGFSDLDDHVLTSLFRLTGALRESWTARQWDYVRSVRTKTQKETAEAFGVTAGAVSQSLTRARFRDVMAAEDAIRRLLEAYQSGAPHRPPTPEAP